MKLWVDARCPAPDDSYSWARTDVTAMDLIEISEEDSNFTKNKSILFEFIDIGCENGEEYFLHLLEITGRNYPIHIHSANPVAVQRMRQIIERNGWKEIE